MAQTLYIGQKAFFSATLTLPGGVSASDSSVDFTLIFYIAGKPESAQRIKKEDCVVDGNTASFVLEIPEGMDQGKLAAFAYVDYTSGEKIVNDSIEVKLDTAYTVAEAPVTKA